MDLLSLQDTPFYLRAGVKPRKARRQASIQSLSSDDQAKERGQGFSCLDDLILFYIVLITDIFSYGLAMLCYTTIHMVYQTCGRRVTGVSLFL